MGEAADVGEVCDVVAVAGEELQGAAGIDGCELCGVADEEDLGADDGGVVGDGVQAAGAGQ